MSRAAVTGLGAVSGLGLGVEALWRGLLRGDSAVRRYAALDAAGLGVGPIAKVRLPADGAADPDSDDGAALLRGDVRATELLRLAAAEALRDAGFSERPPLRLGLVIGTTLGEKAPWVQGLRERFAGREGRPASDFGVAAPAQALAAALSVDKLRVVSTACASGNVALAVALGWLGSGECDAVLAGGVDALQEFVLSGFVSLRAHSGEPCRPFDATRSGLNLGEGAGLLLLENIERAQAAGRRIRAYLSGAGLSCDAHHMTGPDREGRGAARAMQAALSDAELTVSAVDFVSAHGTATVFNDLMEARGLELLLGDRKADVPVNSIKGSLGHTLGAAGALEAVMAVRALEEQTIPPTAGHREPDPQIPLRIVVGEPLVQPLTTVLSTSSGFGGVNAAVVLKQAGEVASPSTEQRSLVPCAVLGSAQLFPRKDEPLAAHLGPRLLAGRSAQLPRMDRLCGLSLCAVDLAIGGRERLAGHFGLPADELAIVIGTQYGCHRTDEEYYRSFRTGQPSPRLFAYTLPSSPVGEISIAYGITGPGLSIVSGRTAGLEALAEAQRLLSVGQAQACLVIAAEVAAPALFADAADVTDGAVALLVTRADRAAPVPSSVILEAVASGYQHADIPGALTRVSTQLPSEAAGCAAILDGITADELPAGRFAGSRAEAACGAGAVSALAKLVAPDALFSDGSDAAVVLSAEKSGLAAAALFRRSVRRGDS